MEKLALYIVFLPLIAAIITGLGVRLFSATFSQVITCSSMVLSALFAGIVFNDVAINGNRYTIELFNWINSGDFVANWAIKVDTLTAVMFVVVTWVSAVVHIYSVGYMSHDDSRQRFMCYLSLFTFCMLMLITSDNFIQLYFGWEGVGLASYLLIGFWFKKDSANKASMKAFIVNRVGDFGMALGVFTIYVVFGSVNFDVVFAAVESKAGEYINLFGIEFNAISAACMLLFIGCMGKSAQFFLHTWLPDAMEGPTPVSALIHAATMVTAGVFLLARCSPLFNEAPDILAVITVVGAFTALFAASVGMVQNDIKRVIAYSTCSQLGYMFFACGVGAYNAAIFHLMTHAFFKALLFLGAGSVIHGMSDEQDMQKMGGIYKKMPYTYAMMWVGTLAILGVPLLAGYYSKEAILTSAFASETGAGHFAFWVGIIVACMTTFYSLRLMFLTFHGESRSDKKVFSHVHESPAIMLLPLILLVIGSIGAGAFGSYVLNITDTAANFWNGAVVSQLQKDSTIPLVISKGPLLVGILLAVLLYLKFTVVPSRIITFVPALHKFLMNRWYIDELYDLIIVRPALYFGKFLWKSGDEKTIDGLGPNGLAASTNFTSKSYVKLHSGYMYHYAFTMLIGSIVLMLWVIHYTGLIEY